MSDAGPTDPYRALGYAPLPREYTDEPLALEGELPAGLRGTFYRVGPNPRFAPRGPYNPLGAEGMVHAIRIDAAGATYRNRWVRTREWRLEDAAGRALFGTAGPAFDDPAVAGQPRDGAANTSVLWHAGRLLALEEGHAPMALDPRTLDTLGRFDFDGRLPRNMTAHPKHDPLTGELVFIANFERGRYDGDVAVHVADAAGALTRSFIVRGPFASLMHDFALTRQHVLLLYCPVTVSVQRLRAGAPPIAFEPGLGTRVGVASRDGAGPGAGEVRWFDAPACMAWHVLNAYDDGGAIVLDLCQQDAPMFPRADGTPPDHLCAHQYLARWRLDLRTGTCAVTRLTDEVCEYPRIDPRRSAQAHRFGYLACRGGPGTADVFQRGIGVYDALRGSFEVFDAGPRCAVAEPVFVPRADDAPEGDGWLLTHVYDEARDASHLAVFDARAVAAGPIARLHLEHRIPVGFHGEFVGPGAAGAM